MESVNKLMSEKNKKNIRTSSSLAKIASRYNLRESVPAYIKATS